MPNAMCSVEGCPQRVKCKGLCGTHYERTRKGKPLEGPIRRYTQQDIALVAAGFRLCGGCQETKPLGAFHLRKSLCKSCLREQSRAWRAANPEMWHRQGKRYREAHPEEVAARKREYNQRDPLARRLQRLAARYGLTAETYTALLDSQDGRCAICRSDEPGGRHGVWQVDHCHDTDAIRGLLCDACNRGLGFFRHDVMILVSATSYLGRQQ